MTKKMGKVLGFDKHGRFVIGYKAKTQKLPIVFIRDGKTFMDFESLWKLYKLNK